MEAGEKTGSERSSEPHRTIEREARLQAKRQQRRPNGTVLGKRPESKRGTADKKAPNPKKSVTGAGSVAVLAYPWVLG